MPALRALKKPAANPLVHHQKHNKPVARPSVHKKKPNQTKPNAYQKPENQVASQRNTHQKRETKPKTYQDKQTQTEKEPKTSGSEVIGQRRKVWTTSTKGESVIADGDNASATSFHYSDVDGPNCHYNMDTEAVEGLKDRK